MTAAIVATQGQLLVALDVIRAGPTDPRYGWAHRFMATSSPKALAAIRDPRDRTRLATATKQAKAAIHRRRAFELITTTDMTRRQIGEIMAAEDGRRETPYDESTVRRWHREYRTG
jgi:hypothetical protein